MDLSTVIGFSIATVLIVIVMQISGGLLLYWDLTSILIVLGGSVGAVMMRRPLGHTFNGLGAIMLTIFNKVQDPYELIDEIADLAKTARAESILALEKVAIANRLLAKAVRYMVDGYDPEVIDQIMAIELAAMKSRHAEGRGVLDDMGEACPAFGMIGTVIGLIVIMANLTDPSKIGPGLAVALITTLYGSMIANMIFMPLAGKLKYRSAEEVINVKIIIEGVRSILNGENPKAIRERLESYLPPTAGEE